MTDCRSVALAFARALATLATAASVAVALLSQVAGAQYLSLGGGPTAAFGGLGGERPTGVGVALSLEQERFARGRAWRGEFLLSGFEAPEENADSVGPIRNIGALAHVV